MKAFQPYFVDHNSRTEQKSKKQQFCGRGHTRQYSGITVGSALGGMSWVSGIKPRLALCKANALPTALSPQPQEAVIKARN